MRGGDDEGARADEVARVAEDLDVLGGVVGDAAPVLQVLWDVIRGWTCRVR